MSFASATISLLSAFGAGVWSAITVIHWQDYGRILWAEVAWAVFLGAIALVGAVG